MENAVDALKIAAAVLVFIIAIGASFSLFGTAKQTADSIILMRDKQKYLESATVDEGVLYTSSQNVETKKNEGSEESKINGVTINGDRIVGIDDVVSTILRYNKEKYGVTVVKQDGTVLARFDSNTENLMRQYYNIDWTVEDNKDSFKKYIEQLKDNTKNDYCSSGVNYRWTSKTDNTLYSLYAIKNANYSNIECGAPWYGNENEIKKRVLADIYGETYTLNGQSYNGKGLYDEMNGKTIYEVINEIDKSKYLSDEGQSTELLQQYQMPTIEVVYIIMN